MKRARHPTLASLVTALAVASASASQLAGAAPPATPESTPAAPPPTVTGPAAHTTDDTTRDETPSSDVATSDDMVADATLPCGVRVIIARDLTLPVAAVVLAVETGTEDDPTDTPGLVHALAYHLLQGNRDAAPGGIARTIHGSGGITSLAIGPAQVRYESLVPASMLGDTIVAEASRLRAPTVSEALWKDTLRAARRDKARVWSVPAGLRAAAHEAEGLAHDGHAVSEAVAAMSDRAVTTALAQRFGYDRSTLVVVAPDPPDLVLNLVLAAFADLPPTPRVARDRTAPPRSGSTPRVVNTGGANPTTLVWPVPADPAGQAWAEVICGALNRLRRGSGESNRVRVRCSIDDDGRRGVMIVKAAGADDPHGVAADRLSRVANNDEDALAKERAVVASRLAYALRSPLPLARHLARATSPGRPPGAEPMRATDEVVATAAVRDGTTVPEAFAHLLQVGAAVVVAPSGKPGDANAASPRPAEAKPAEAKPGAAKPAEVKP